MNGFFVVAMAVAVVGYLSAAALTTVETPDSESIVRQVYAAMNAGDVEAAMTLFADDATVTIRPASVATGRSDLHGKAQIRSVFQAVVAQSDRGEIVGPVEVSGDEVHVRARYSGDHLRRLGIDTLEDTASWVVRDSKIQSAVTTYTPESVAALERARAVAAQAQAHPVLTTSLPEFALGGYAVIAGLGLLGSVVLGALVWRRFSAPHRA
jgi:ketosteroid isomerase-like protein